MNNKLDFAVGFMAGFLLTALLATFVFGLWKEPPKLTHEQIRQEKLRSDYERGERVQSLLRGAAGAKPIHEPKAEAEKNP
jgi:hypothetical protein